MKIGSLKTSQVKSLFVNSIYNFTKCLSENVDENTGYAFYRGILYSYDNAIHISLLGTDSNGSFRIVKFVSVGGVCKTNSRGIINLYKIDLELDSLLKVIEQLPFPVSKVYFDFAEKVNVSDTNCYFYEDWEEAGSEVILVESVKDIVDTYMLKSVSSWCKNTLLCDNWSDVYSKLLYFNGAKGDTEWFSKRGIRFV